MRAISLFSGAGGLDLGLEQAGFKVMAHVEANAACRQTLTVNRPSVPLFGDVRTISGKDLLAVCHDPHLVAGGPPCQSFSLAGKRLSFGDDRGLMAFEFGRIVKETMPRMFLMENVTGLVSARDGDNEPGSALARILDAFEALGYALSHRILDAVDYGVPQFRKRLFVIGVLSSSAPLFLSPTCHKDSPDPARRWRTLFDAIGGMEDDPGEYHQFSPRRLRFLDKIPPGGNWRSLGKTDQEDAMGKAFHSGGGRTGFFRRLAWDRPSPTLMTSPIQQATMMCHPSRLRPLGVKEYAAIQQFPPTWKFAGSTGEIYRQIGNAVPVGLGYWVGRTLMSLPV